METKEENIELMELGAAKEAETTETKTTTRRLNLGWVVALNVALALTEIVVGTSIHSLALVSDGAHNFSDAASAYVAMLAESFDANDYDRDRLPFGYARATTVGALARCAAHCSLSWSK